MIGNILKELRKEKNLTAKKLSITLNISTNLIYEWEHNRCEPSLEMIIKISKFFNVSVDYLLGLEDDFGVKQFDGSPSPVSQDELLLIKKLRALNLSTQEAFRIQINAMYEKEVKGEKV